MECGGIDTALDSNKYSVQNQYLQQSKAVSMPPHSIIYFTTVIILVATTAPLFSTQV